MTNTAPGQWRDAARSNWASGPTPPTNINDMDNRKLTAHTARNTVVSLHLEDHGIPNSIIARMELMINDQDLAAELVKRWNAYPELITVLDDLMYELKARDENYDMRETYGRADRLLKSIDPDLGDSND